MATNTWDDFTLFARALVASGDLDPTAVLLRRLYATEKLPTETALWRSLLVLTWWHVGSAERVWKTHARPAEIDSTRFASLPVGVERRSFKGVVGNVQARAFVSNVLKRASGGLAKWAATFGSGEAGWRSARREFESIPGAGPWASWRWAELLRSVHGFDLRAPHVGTGAPIAPLAALVGKPAPVVAVDTALHHDTLLRARRAGVELDGLDELRAVLVAFGSLGKGAYYVGRGIDAQMEQLDGASSALWAARAAFPTSYRGERAKKPWSGVRKELCRAYAARGEIVNVWV